MSQPSYNTTYNGYYYKGEYNITDKLEDILLNTKGNNSSIGDYLLISSVIDDNIDSIILNKLTEINEDTYIFTQTNPGDKYLFYATKFYFDGSIIEVGNNKILYIDNISQNVEFSNYNEGNFDLNDTIFMGLYGDDNLKPNNVDRDTLYLSIDKTLDDEILSLNYSGNNNEWTPVITGLSQFEFDSRIDVYYALLDLKSENVKILSNNVREPTNYNYTFNGYYSGENTDQDPNYYNILNSIKTSLELGSPQIGDYLLLKNTYSVNTYVKLLKLVKSNLLDNSDFIEIETTDKFLFYSVNGDNDANIRLRSLYININIVTLIDNNIDDNISKLKLFDGLISNSYISIIETISDYNNKFCLYNGSLEDKYTLQQCYETSTNIYEFIPLYTCLSKFTFMNNHNIYLIYTELNSEQVFINKIIYSEIEYDGYQGFYDEYISSENDIFES